jgi:hypothetical protein
MARRRYDEYPTGLDGWCEWVLPVQTGYRMACCGCGLTHEVDYRVNDQSQVEWRMRIDRRATANARRRK